MLKEVLRAGHMAPSAGNLQARDFVIIKDNEVKELLCMAALNQYFILGAPVCIVVCANVSALRLATARGVNSMPCRIPRPPS